MGSNTLGHLVTKPEKQIKELMPLSGAVAALIKAQTLREVSKIRALAKAAVAYAKAEKLGREAVEAGNYVRNESGRRLGEIFAETKAKGERRKGAGEGRLRDSLAGTPKLSDLGYTAKESMTFQQMAAIPRPAFERLSRGIAANVSERKLVEIAREEGLLSPVKPRQLPPGWDAESLRQQGEFMRLCADLPKMGSPSELVGLLRPLDEKGKMLSGAEDALSWLADVVNLWHGRATNREKEAANG